MAATNWEVKVTLARHLRQDAQRAQRWRVRLKELRSGPLSRDNNTGLAEVVDYASRAHHMGEYIAGMAPSAFAPVIAWRQAGFPAEELREVAWIGVPHLGRDGEDVHVCFPEQPLRRVHP